MKTTDIIKSRKVTFSQSNYLSGLFKCNIFYRENGKIIQCFFYNVGHNFIIADN